MDVLTFTPESGESTDEMGKWAARIRLGTRTRRRLNVLVLIIVEPCSKFTKLPTGEEATAGGGKRRRQITPV